MAALWLCLFWKLKSASKLLFTNFLEPGTPLGMRQFSVDWYYLDLFIENHRSSWLYLPSILCTSVLDFSPQTAFSSEKSLLKTPSFPIKLSGSIPTNKKNILWDSKKQYPGKHPDPSGPNPMENDYRRSPCRRETPGISCNSDTMILRRVSLRPPGDVHREKPRFTVSFRFFFFRDIRCVFFLSVEAKKY